MRQEIESGARPLTAATFVAGLLDPERPEPENVTGPGGKATRKRYAVYRNNVVASLSKALEEVFPAVRRIVGEAFFAGMARTHLRQSPPGSPLLFAYGADFPDFIDRFEPARDLPYLADVARIERAWLDAYHAADADTVGAEILGSVGPEQLDELRFEPHPAMCILRSRYAAHAIFAANRSDDPPVPINASRPETTLVTRPRMTVQTRRLEPGQAAFLDALADGGSLSLALAAGLSETTAFDPAGAVGLMVDSGALRLRGSPATPFPESRPPQTRWTSRARP